MFPFLFLIVVVFKSHFLYVVLAFFRWMRNLGKERGSIFDMERLYLPINLDSRHWALAVIFLQEKKIRYHYTD